MSKLYIGNQTDCSVFSDFYIIHACKYPCHNRVVGNPTKTHPNYLVYSDGTKNLYLNMVDMQKPWLKEFALPMFEAALSFLITNEGQDRLVHCNHGMSRSAAIVMMYLKFQSFLIGNFQACYNDFKSYWFPEVALGAGIEAYLREDWDFLCEYFR